MYADTHDRPGLDELKRCATCGEEKPRRMFSPDKKGNVGTAHCTPCGSKRRAERKKAQFPDGKTAEQREKERAYTRKYIAKDPARRKAMLHENYLQNKETVLARGLAWIKAHPEVNAARSARRRANARSADSHTAADVKALLRAQRGLCPVCRADIGQGYEVDHIHPISKGGDNTKSNIQLLCQPCNRSKHAKHPVDFMQEKGFLL